MKKFKASTTLEVITAMILLILCFMIYFNFSTKQMFSAKTNEEKKFSFFVNEAESIGINSDFLNREYYRDNYLVRITYSKYMNIENLILKSILIVDKENVIRYQKRDIILNKNG